MGKYLELETDIYSVFNSNGWKAENIKTYPLNFITVDPGNRFIRVSIIPASEGLNLRSVAGLVMIDIFTAIGNGTNDIFTIADLLNTYLVGKTFSLGQNGSTQFMSSTVRPDGVDKDNPSLYRATYSIPFNYYGVN